MKIKFIAFTSFITLCSWNCKNTVQMKKAEWLAGTWQNKTPEGIIYESWKKISDELMTGKSYMLKGKDTIVFETIALRQIGNDLVYIPRLQNSNKTEVPARFTLKSSTNTQLIFENKTHDFPQIISYTQINPDSLVAEISGTQNGKTKKETFPMSKVKH